MSQAIQTTIRLAQRILDSGSASQRKNQEQKALMQCFTAVLDLLEVRGQGNAQITALVACTRDALKLNR